MQRLPPQELLESINSHGMELDREPLIMTLLIIDEVQLETLLDLQELPERDKS